MSERTPARPAQVTLAGWLVVGGSVVVVLLAFSEVAGLRSLETREAVEEYLAKPPGDALGLGVQGVLDLLRVASHGRRGLRGGQRDPRLAGAAALEGRPGRAVACSPSRCSSAASSSPAHRGRGRPGVVTAAVVMLWFQPARDWFDGTVRTPPPAPLPPPAREPVGTSRSVANRRATSCWTCRRRPRRRCTPRRTPPGPRRRSVARGPAAASAPRPPAVRWACMLTWVVLGRPPSRCFGDTLIAMLLDPQHDRRRDAPAERRARRAGQRRRDPGRPLRHVRRRSSLWSLAAIGLAVLASAPSACGAASLLMVSAGRRRRRSALLRHVAGRQPARWLPSPRARLRPATRVGRVGRDRAVLRPVPVAPPEPSSLRPTAQALRSAARPAGPAPSSITSRVLQNAHRTRCRPGVRRVVVERPGRDRDHPGALGQRQAERHRRPPSPGRGPRHVAK